MLLLSDPVEEVKARDAEAARVGREVERSRKEVVQGVRRLLGAKPEVGTEADETAMVVDVREAQDKGGSEHKEVDGGRQKAAAEEDEDDDDGFEQVA
jgi:hypothetical protein